MAREYSIIVPDNMTFPETSESCYKRCAFWCEVNHLFFSQSCLA